jgi:hypothetical protein
LVYKAVLSLASNYLAASAGAGTASEEAGTASAVAGTVTSIAGTASSFLPQAVIARAPNTTSKIKRVIFNFSIRLKLIIKI